MIRRGLSRFLLFRKRNEFPLRYMGALSPRHLSIRVRERQEIGRPHQILMPLTRDLKQQHPGRDRRIE